MEITNVRVYDIDDSIVESGLAHSSEPVYSEDRAVSLGNAPVASGHDCYLKGIGVRCRITADHSFWLQWMRYHFADIVTSESKMHSITNMELKFHKYVWDYSKSEIEYAIKCYNTFETTGGIYFDGKNKQEAFEEIIMNCPIGLELTASITTNYLQLKNMYSQRHKHKMSSWRTLCTWIEGLPKSKELFLKDF